MDAASQKFEEIIDGMKAYTSEELEAALRAVGFSCPRFAPVLTRPSLTIAPIPVPELPVLVRKARWTQSLRRSLDTVSGEAHPTCLSEFSGEKVCLLFYAKD